MKPTIILLVFLLTVATSSAVSLGFLYFARPAHVDVGYTLYPVQGEIAAAKGPLVQKDTVSPRTLSKGTVNYATPYAHSPNLKLTAPKRHYVISQQDEMGFTWIAMPMTEDFLDTGAKLDDFLKKPLQAIAATALKPNIVYEDLVWEASGMRATNESLRMRVFEQTGQFGTVIGQEGPIGFPIPFAIAPNVEIISGPNVTSLYTIVTSLTPTGFKWKNVGTNANFCDGLVTWKARGVRAAELPIPTAK
jgi:hypothetical protein